MTRILISPEVAAAIGAEQADRYRTEPALQSGECWVCGNPVDADDEPAAVLCLVPETGAELLTVATLAHARCTPSEVRRLSAGDILQAHARHHTAAAGDVVDGTHEVSAAAVLWPGAGDGPTGRAMLLVSFRDELTMQADSGDRVDALAGHFLGAGWELCTRMGRAPAAEPDGWAVTFRMLEEDHAAAGHLQLLAPRGYVVADIDPWQPAPLWLPAVLTDRYASVYVGPLVLHTWIDGIDYATLQRVIGQGLLVAARLPVEVLDPDGRPYRLDDP